MNKINLTMFEKSDICIYSGEKNAILRSAPKMPSFVSTFEEGMPKLEKEERARRAYTEIADKMIHEPYRLQDRLPEYHIITQMYCKETSILRVVKFYQACLTIRENFVSWKEYISDPTKGAPLSLGSITEDSELVLGLVLLDKCKIIHLDPSEPFIRGEERRWSDIFIDAKVNLECFRDIVPLWIKLQKPAFLTSNLMDILSENESSGSKIERVGYFLPNGGLGYSTGSLERDLYQNIGVMLWIFQTPIHRYDDNTYVFDYRQLTVRLSFAMALESKETDLLDYIYKLFPEYPEFVPRIISEYCDQTMSVPYGFNESLQENETVKQVEKMHEEAFGCDLFYQDNESEWTGLYHRGALRQIREHPELFESWKTIKRKELIYRTLVTPALREKLEMTSTL